MKKERLRGLWIYLFLVQLSIAIVVSESRDFRCASDQFKCDNEKCITFAWRCDWEDDCGDNSDEKNCEQQTCATYGQFRCKSGKCIRSNWVCDHEDDCGDNSDEFKCEHLNVTCSPSQFHCAKGNRCIPKTWVCDGDDDCGDRTDELHCRHATCGPNAFTCKNKKCIQARWQCDEDDDCGDRSDEDASVCGKASCKPGFFPCNNKRCVLQQWTCDGEDDCGDGSDELPPTCAKTKQPSCHTGEIACKSGLPGPLGRCILRQWKCDGDRDCHDGSDEEDCPDKTTCSPSQFTCGSGKCIELSQKCDGKKDCPEGDDEEQCPTNCAPDEFKCGASGMCIKLSQVCDMKKDCYHGEDEPGTRCFINECIDHNGHCTHYCNDSLIGYSCSCRPGYELAIDKRTCLDINECIIPGKCSQFCENKKGSYKCGCLSSYVLEPNGRTCKAIGPRPFLILSDRRTIRSLNFDSTDYRSLIGGLSSVIWITYDIHEEALYWSDTRVKGILRAPMYTTSHVQVIVPDLGLPDGLAVDWIGRKLYWADSGNNLIQVSELDGSNVRTLINTGLENPRAIAIDPTEYGRKLYWTDWGDPKIECMSLDGDLSTRTVIHNLNDSWPNGLTIDFTIRKLYWVDAKQETIECSNMDGSDRTLILKVRGQHPFSVSVFEDHVFWMDWQSESIYKADKFTGEGRQVVQGGIYSPMGLEVYHPMRQPNAKNPCGMYNGGCSHLCLLSSSSERGYSCACPKGVNLLPNGQTCDSPDAYYCKPNFCLHGGLCSNGTQSKPALPVCKCSDGYAGRRCQVIIPCKDCAPSTASPNTDGNSGNQKSRGSSAADKGITIGMVLGVVIGIITIATIIGCLFQRYLRREYRERKTINFENPVYQRTTDDMVPIIAMEECHDASDISQC